MARFRKVFVRHPRTTVVAFLLATAVPARAQVVQLDDGWQARAALPSADLSLGTPGDEGWTSAHPWRDWRAQGLASDAGTIWYRRHVTVPWREGPGALLLMPSRQGWLQVYADGVLLGQVGSPSSPHPFPRYRSLELPEELTADGDVTLAVRFSPVEWTADAFDLGEGAVAGRIELGPVADVSERHALLVLLNRHDQLSTLLFALVFVVAGLYHLLLFWPGAADREYVWFGLGSILFAANAVAFSAWTPAFVDSYGTAYRASDVTGHLATAVMISFLWGLLDRPMTRALRLYQGSHLLFAALALVVPLQWLVVTAEIRFAWLVPILFWGLYVLQDESSRGNRDAIPVTVGGSFLVVAELAELARVGGAPLPTGLPNLGFSIFLLSMAVALAYRFRRTRRELDALTAGMEERVVERTASLQAEADRARAANDAKNRFLSAMSHELRTPLNSVIGFTRVMLRRGGEQLSDRDRGFVRRIHHSGRNLLALIDQILDMARIEEGRFEVREKEGVDLGELVGAVVGDLEPTLEGRHVELRAIVPTQLRTVRTDEERLRQVLLGLAGTAVQFTPEGTVTLRVVAHRDIPMALEVTDTGVGTDPEDLERGGFGLALARAVCEALGYELQIDSEAGRGSTFRIVLTPSSVEAGRAADEVEGVLEVLEGRATTSGGEKLVLVIDDDPDARSLLIELLSDLGCRSVTASSGEEGMRLARELRPDLVTLDLRMPGLDGWTVLNVFRQDEKLSQVPVIVVSVVAEEARGEILGPVEMVSKPVDPTELARAVARQTGRIARRTLVVDDDPDSRALLGDPLAELGSEIREAANGAEALEALENFDADLILLDLVMPGMDGFEFLERLRRDPERANLPVIIVTSKQLDRDEVRLLRQTSQGLVRKGRRLDRHELRERLARYLEEGAP